MANEDLGTLRYGIEVDTKGVDKGQEAMDGLQKSADETSKKVDGAEKSIDKVGKTSTTSAKEVDKLDKATTDVGISMRDAVTYAGAFAASLTTIAAISAESAKEIQNMARLSGTSVEEFQRLAFGANEAGISAEKLGDIYKDAQDKMGDFTLNAGGELLDFFDNVAPKIGMTAAEFENLSGPEILGKLFEGIEKANLSGQQQINILESLANDASLLAPLLANNAQGFSEAGKRAGELNVVLSQFQIDQLVEVNKAFNELSTTISRGTQSIVADNAEDIIDAINSITEAVSTGTRFLNEHMDTIKTVASVVAAGTTAWLAYRAAVVACTLATQTFDKVLKATPMGRLVTIAGLAAGAIATYMDRVNEASLATARLTGNIEHLNDAQRESLRLDLEAQAVDLYEEIAKAKEKQAEAQEEFNKKGKIGNGILVDTNAEVLAAQANVSTLEKQYDKLIEKIGELKAGTTKIEINEGQPVEVKVKPTIDDDTFFAYTEYSEAMAEAMKKGNEKGAKEGLKAVPSDFAMSVGNALASQDYSSFANILASQAAGSIGTAVTDAVGGSLGGVAGGLVGGAAGAVISQAISDFMEDDLIALERQASQGTGTVLGSIDAKSQSIANSLDYMSEGLDDLIGVNTDGFKAIQALSDSLTGASNLIARDFDTSGIASSLGLSGLGSITQDFGGIVDDFFGGLTGGLFEDVFGGIGGALFGSSSVSDQGINLLSGTIAELIENDVTQAYQTVTKKSLFSSSRKTSYEFAGDAIEQQFDLTLEAMRDAVTTSAESLGMLPSEIQANLDAFTIEAQKISIKDLSAEEVADELEAVFSSIFDNLSSAVVPYVDDFQQAGEGAGETLSRLSTNLSVVDEMLAQLRLGELQGTTQEMLTLSEGVVDFFGDASSLASAFTGFVDEFATQERQLEILTGNLTEALGEQDVAILNSRDGVYDYIASLEQLDGDNVERIANILSLTDSIDEYFDLLEAVNESTADYTDLQIRLAEAQDNDALATRLTREQELADAVDDTARGLLNSIYAAEDLAEAQAQAADESELLSTYLRTLGRDDMADLRDFTEQLGDAMTETERSIMTAIRQQELLNDARDEEVSKLDNLLSILQKAADTELDALREQLDQQIEDSSSALTDLRDDINDQIEAEQKRADAEVERLQNEQEATSTAIDNAKSLINLLDSAMNTLAERSEDLQATLFKRSFAEITSAIETARLTGELPDSELIEGAISSLSTAGSGNFATSVEREREALKARILLSELSELSDDQLTTDEKTLKQLELLETSADENSEAVIEALNQQLEDAENNHDDLVDSLDAQYDDAKDYYDSMIESQQNQLDALNGINDSFDSFAQVMEEVANQIGVTLSAQSDATGAVGTTITDQDIRDFLSPITADQYVSDTEAQDIYNAALSYGVSSSRVGDILNSMIDSTIDIQAWLDRNNLAAINGSSTATVEAINTMTSTVTNSLARIETSTASTATTLSDVTQGSELRTTAR